MHVELPVLFNIYRKCEKEYRRVSKEFSEITNKIAEKIEKYLNRKLKGEEQKVFKVDVLPEGVHVIFNTTQLEEDVIEKVVEAMAALGFDKRYAINSYSGVGLVFKWPRQWIAVVKEEEDKR